jgi:thiol-disulfide isomerase/thioredoxin
MISLPDIIQSSASFPAQDVILLGVNLRESTEVIQKTLKQRNLALEVAMDLTGSIAEKYNASSIPRTIIVDREGIIRWGHTGSSPGLGQEITRVIDALIKGLPLDVQSVEGVGADAPHFSTRLLDGTPFSLEQLTGKVTILDFWATWCGPCIQAMPELIETVQSFDKEKVSLIAVNQGQSTQIINDFIKRKGWDLTVALDMDQSIGKSFKVNAIPHTVIIGTDGKIQHIQIGYRNGLKDSLTRQIQRLLE